MDDKNIVDNELSYKAYGHFWLWVLSSFEISRTMCQYKHCFSPQLSERICAFKKQISKLRMPFSKLEPRGIRKPIFAEGTVRKFDLNTKDFIFEIENEDISLRNSINEFNSIFNSITIGDVIGSIYGESYKTKGS
jgi:hypothetical protein